MAIEKRILPNGRPVGWNTERKCYCPLPKELTNAPVGEKSLEEMTHAELKALAAKMEIKYTGNLGSAKLIELIEDARDEDKDEDEDKGESGTEGE